MMDVFGPTGSANHPEWEPKEYSLQLDSASPWEKYPAKQHARKVQEKLGLEQGIIYLPGQPARNNEDSDMPAPFRQRRYFYYLSGCNEPNCFLTYDIGRDVLCLFIPRINPERVIWNGRGSNKAEALDKYDIDTVRWSDELPAYLRDWTTLKKNRNAPIFALSTDSRPPVHPQLEPIIDYDALKPAMNVSRMVKDDHEIALIRKANDISSKAHAQVLAHILKFRNEAQVEGLFMDFCISRQAKQQAYDPIAASGPNAGTLHYDANNEDFEDRQLMCLDAGCEYKLYASDVTRTFPLSANWPSQEAESIYKLVQTMQENCIKQLAPGVRYLDLHIQAHQIAISGLLQLGIFHNGSKEEIFKAGTSRAFFPYGLGHHIGLEVHDVGQKELMSVRRGRAVHERAPSLYPEGFHSSVYDPTTCQAPTDPESSHLEEGMVVTVEPGIYFSVYALEQFYFPSPKHAQYINREALHRYLPVGGVRIEDDILITSRGYENLTTAPKGEEMLEIIRNGQPCPRKDSSSEDVATRRRSIEETTIRVRAPGISANTTEPILRPLARAATLPSELRPRDTVDFEPSNGPSLFAEFRRSMTVDEKMQRWQKQKQHSEVDSTLVPVCGQKVENVRHMYIYDGRSLTDSIKRHRGSMGIPTCRNCMILVQSLERLRRNLTWSEQGSPKLEQKILAQEPHTAPPSSSQKCVATTSRTRASEKRASLHEPERKDRPNTHDCYVPDIANTALTRGPSIRSGAFPCNHCQTSGYLCQVSESDKICKRCQYLRLPCKSKDEKIIAVPSPSPCEECVSCDLFCENFGTYSSCKACISRGKTCLYIAKEDEKKGPFSDMVSRQQSIEFADRRLHKMLNAPVDAIMHRNKEVRSEHTATSESTSIPLYASFPTFTSTNTSVNLKQQARTSNLPSSRPDNKHQRAFPASEPSHIPVTMSTADAQPSHELHFQNSQNERIHPPLPSGWEFARGLGRSALEQAKAKAVEQRHLIETRHQHLAAQISIPLLQSPETKNTASATKIEDIADNHDKIERVRKDAQERNTGINEQHASPW